MSINFLIFCFFVLQFLFTAQYLIQYAAVLCTAPLKEKKKYDGKLCHTMSTTNHIAKKSVLLSHG